MGKTPAFRMQALGIDPGGAIQLLIWPRARMAALDITLSWHVFVVISTPSMEPLPSRAGPKVTYISQR
jgi:hypothetical protein